MIVFLTEWNRETKTAEQALCKCLTDHLNRVIRNTQEDIRSMTDKTYQKIKQLDPANAKIIVEEGIHQAEADRQKRNKEILKRKKERQNEKPWAPN